MAALYFFKTQSSQIDNNCIFLEDIFERIKNFDTDNSNDSFIKNIAEDLEKRFENRYVEICNLVDCLSLYLHRELNMIHGVNESPRYWETIYITCLHRIAETIIEKFDLLTKIVDYYSITQVFIPRVDAIDLISNDSIDFIQKSRNSMHWNIFLCAKLVELIPNVSKNFTDETVVRKDVDILKSADSKTKIDRIIEKVSITFLGKLSSRNQVFIYKSYVNMWDQVVLSWKFQQFCVNFRTNSDDLLNKSWSYDNISRKLLENKSEVFGLELVARHILPLVWPKAFLEGYLSLLKVAKKQPWPKRPSIIFTSNAYDTDEVFKIWTALKVKHGAKYFIGQHGYGIGVSKFPLSERYYKRIAHHFITLGINKDDFTIPTYNFLKRSIRGSFKTSISGSILIVTGLPKVDKFGLSRSFSFSRLKVINLVKNLANNGITKLVIRLHPLDSRVGWDFGHVENSKIPIFYSWGIKNFLCPYKVKLVIFTYESTLLLRVIFDNTPFILLMKNLDHIIPEFRKFYKELIDVNIIVEDWAALQHLIIQVQDDVSSWWNNEKRKRAIARFRENFCSTKNSRTLELYDALKFS